MSFNFFISCFIDSDVAALSIFFLLPTTVFLRGSQFKNYFILICNCCASVSQTILAQQCRYHPQILNLARGRSTQPDTVNGQFSTFNICVNSTVINCFCYTCICRSPVVNAPCDFYNSNKLKISVLNKGD